MTSILQANLSEGKVIASPLLRLVSGIIDLIVIAIIDLVIVIYTGTGSGFSIIPVIPGIAGRGLISLPTVFLLTVLIVPWLYYAILESSTNQATFGKMAARVTVTDIKGNRLTFTRATFRHFCKFISVIALFSGFFCIIYTKYNQGLHDIIAATLCWNQKQIIE